MNSVPPKIYQALVLAKGLKLYSQTGMKPNRAWTPSAMLRSAMSITGKHYKRGEYMSAHDDIMKVLDIAKLIFNAVENGFPIGDMTAQELKDDILEKNGDDYEVILVNGALELTR